MNKRTQKLQLAEALRKNRKRRKLTRVAPLTSDFLTALTLKGRALAVLERKP